ncbi:phosphoadenosine phosphosulfate reductase domain-containing protein [Methanopyrus sp.]
MGGRVHLHVLVRARKDASAVESALERYYPDWEWKVETLGGERDPSWIVGLARERFEDSDAPWKVLLLGRRSYPGRGRVVWMEGWSMVNVGKAEVRNARLTEIVDGIELGRAAPRLSVAFRRAPELRRGNPLTEDQDADTMLRWDRFTEVIAELTGEELASGAYLSLRKPGNPPEEVVYDASGRPVLRIVTPDEGEPNVGVLGSGEPFDSKTFVRENCETLKELFEDAVNFLGEVAEGFDVLFVPVSGGKDSTCCLAIAVEAADRLGVDVEAVYVDTGYDLGGDIIEDVEAALGIDIERVDVSDRFERGLRERKPTHEDRWCTGVKLSGIKEALKDLEEEDVLLVVGDRDAESRRRRLRPPVHRNRLLNVPEVNPVKGWGGAEVLGTLFRLGLPVSELYEIGFYRLGCSVCPSLTSWERTLMELSR